MKMKALIALTLALAFAGRPGWAADPESCKSIRMSDVGWTDNDATNGAVTAVLKGLSYAPQTQMLSVPVTFKYMSEKQIDIFLDDWMPAQQADRKPYIDNKSIEVIGLNLEGAKYTLAVPGYLYKEGLRSFSDIARFRERLGGKIYGIEPGNDGNRLILDGPYDLEPEDRGDSSEMA